LSVFANPKITETKAIGKIPCMGVDACLEGLWRVFFYLFMFMLNWYFLLLKLPVNDF